MFEKVEGKKGCISMISYCTSLSFRERRAVIHEAWIGNSKIMGKAHC